MRTEIIIRATRTQNVLGEKGTRIRELTYLAQKRSSSQKTVLIFTQQAESLRYKFPGRLAFWRYASHFIHGLIYFSGCIVSTFCFSKSIFWKINFSKSIFWKIN